MKIDLRKLTFGAPAAERDISAGLKDYFFESEAYSRALNRKCTIVLGNRGAGKSAIFKVLADKARMTGALVLELNPEDYSYEMLSSSLRLEREGSWAKQGAFASAWKYLIFVQVMKGLCAGGGFKSGDSAKVYEYLRDNHSGEQANPIAMLISHLKRIESIKIGGQEATFKTKELARLYKLQEIEPLLASLAEMCRKRRVLVFVDELDRGWDASEDAKAFVAGLFQACVSTNELTPNLTTYVSLRRELYDSIPTLYEDAQKYRDIIEVIQWDEPELLSVVANRVRHCFPILRDSSDIDCWHSVFGEQLTYRKAKSFNYMIDRTLYRPREIIQFCIDAVNRAVKDQVYPIDYPVISKAELSYSEERTKDIAAEYKYQYPGLRSVFEVFRSRTYDLHRDDLELIALGLSSQEYRLDKEAGWIIGQDHEVLIEILWRIGFLRAWTVGGQKALRRSGSSYLGPHQVSHLNLRNISRFQVHPMFRAFLGMKEPKGESGSGSDTA